MERTWTVGEGIKRGDFSLSKQRKDQMVESYRTLDPALQEVPKTAKTRVSRNFENTFDFQNQDYKTERVIVPPKY